MKNFKIAALSLAVGSVLTAGQAFAGTEACFESYQVADDVVVTDHAVLYTPATCDADRTAVDTATAATALYDLSNSKVAFELTGDYDFDLEVVNASDDVQHIVYIPTTDIPPASRITLELSGADFGTGNADQMYLVQDDGAFLQTIASSDGAFDETNQVEFLTKAGVTIGAGSRLLLSSLNPEDVVNTDGSAIAGISIHLDNDKTCSPDTSVTIAAVSAKTDGDTTISGAISSKAVEILSVAEQFVILEDSDDTTVIEVNAEDPSFRTQFVVESGVAVIEDEAFWETKIINNYADFDDAIVIDSDDEFTLNISATSATGDGVVFSLETDTSDVTDSSILDENETNYRIAAGTDVVEIIDEDGEGIDDDQIVLTTSSTAYTFDAEEVFASGAVSTVANIAAILTNLDEEIMEFNYEVETTYGLDFDNSDYLDKDACQDATPFEVGVNGAVLKVPYVFDITSNWVRITSEHTSEATIFLDVFDESSNTIKNIEVGTIQPKSSVVHTVASMLDMAEAAGYDSDDDRHTMTFTVTAPKNTVHGVSVQAIPGGVDRVMPVLDQNDWTQ